MKSTFRDCGWGPNIWNRTAGLKSLCVWMVQFENWKCLRLFWMGVLTPATGCLDPCHWVFWPQPSGVLIPAIGCFDPCHRVSWPLPPGVLNPATGYFDSCHRVSWPLPPGVYSILGNYYYYHHHYFVYFSPFRQILAEFWIRPVLIHVKLFPLTFHQPFYRVRLHSVMFCQTAVRVPLLVHGLNKMSKYKRGHNFLKNEWHISHIYLLIHNIAEDIIEFIPAVSLQFQYQNFI